MAVLRAVPAASKIGGSAWAHSLQTGVGISPGQSATAIQGLIRTASATTMTTTAAVTAAAVSYRGFALGQALCRRHEDLTSLHLPATLRGRGDLPMRGMGK